MTDRQLAAPLAALVRARFPWVVATGAVTLWTLIHDLGKGLANLLLSGGLPKLAALVDLLNIGAIFLAFASLSVLAVRLRRLNENSDVGALDGALAAEARYWKVLAIAVLPTYALSWVVHALIRQVPTGL